MDKVLKLLIHEVMHVLGFTLDKMMQFPCPDDPSFNRHRLTRHRLTRHRLKRFEFPPILPMRHMPPISAHLPECAHFTHLSDAPPIRPICHTLCRHQPKTWEPKPCESSGLREPIDFSERFVNGVSYQVKLVKTPTVLMMARRHYNCPETAAQRADGATVCKPSEPECLDGMPLEDHGGEGTASSHWEKRVMYSELMSGES